MENGFDQKSKATGNRVVSFDEFQAAVETIRLFEKQTRQDEKLARSYTDTLSPFVGITKNTKLKDVGMSIRLFNTLKHHASEWGIDFQSAKVSCLENVTRRMLLTCRNFGKRSLTEVEQICKYSGITLMRD
jgi:DNA-directed RNA polymerase alpha subunit